MKKLFLLLILAFFGVQILLSQSIGFSYFFPKNGYFGNPIAPISFSLPISFGKYFQISPGICMTNIGGMSMSGFPENYKSNIPLIGPFQSLETSLIPSITIPVGNSRTDISGGVFAFTSFNTKLMTGNFNEMLSEAYDFQAVNSSLDVSKSVFGWGYVFGLRFNLKVTNKQWIYLAGYYYMGKQNFSLNANITAIDNNDNIIRTEKKYPETSLLYHGLSISIGIMLKK